MPEVSFTLQDIRDLVREEVRGEIGSFREEVQAEFHAVRQEIEESEFRIVTTVKECFEHYDERFADMAADIKSIRRLVGQHSKEIMELKARAA